MTVATTIVDRTLNELYRPPVTSRDIQSLEEAVSSWLASGVSPEAASALIRLMLF